MKDRKIFIDRHNKCVLAIDDRGFLVFKYIDKDDVFIFDNDLDNRQAVDIYDLTDQEAKYNQRIIKILS